jgi:sensor histidine kinase YesM
MNKKLKRTLHLLFIVFFISPLLVQFIDTKDLELQSYLWISIIILVYLALYFSSFFFVSIHITTKGSLWKGIIYFLFWNLLCEGLRLGLILIFQGHPRMLSFQEINWFTFGAGDFLNNSLVMLLAIFVRVILKSNNDQKVKADLLLQQEKQELAFLKAQLNPHFFFNTLNNIYSLFYTGSKQAPVALMKLSEIMRYIMYEAKTETVPLSQELT